MQFLSYGPKILLAVIIPVFDDLYHKVAVWLNDMGQCLLATVLLRGQGRIILLLECLLKVQVSLQVKSLRVIMWFMVKTTRTVGLRSCPSREIN